MDYIINVDLSLFGKPYYNYKGLQFYEANRQFVKDFKIYYDKDICYYRIKGGELVKVSSLDLYHIKNIIKRMGTKRVMSRCPLVYYRYLTECLGIKEE